MEKENKKAEIINAAQDVPCRTYTVRQIREMLGISQATAYRLMKSGSFRVVKVGGAIRISKKSFDEWLEH